MMGLIVDARFQIPVDVPHFRFDLAQNIVEKSFSLRTHHGQGPFRHFWIGTFDFMFRIPVDSPI